MPEAELWKFLQVLFTACLFDLFYFASFIFCNSLHHFNSSHSLHCLFQPPFAIDTRQLWQDQTWRRLVPSTKFLVSRNLPLFCSLRFGDSSASLYTSFLLIYADSITLCYSWSVAAQRHRCLDTTSTEILALCASAFVERGNRYSSPPAEKLPLNKQQSQRSHSANRKLQGYADEPFAPTLPLEPSVLCLHLQRIAFCKIG